MRFICIKNFSDRVCLETSLEYANASGTWLVRVNQSLDAFSRKSRSV